MSALAERFTLLQTAKRCGFIPFIVAGDPNLALTAKLLSSLSELDPVAIEVGVPFSDPTADGPVIQRASQRALQKGTTLQRVLQTTAQCSVAAPLVLFSYYNPILQFGIPHFASVAAASNISGVLAVDLPAEAAGPLQVELRRYDIDLIFLVAPTTSDERLDRIARLASGFIYAVSRTGVTGSAQELQNESEQLVRRIRQHTDLPIAVGFGIATRQQVQRVCRYADAAVVGSKLVAEIERAIRDDGPRAVVRTAVACATDLMGLRRRST